MGVDLLWMERLGDGTAEIAALLSLLTPPAMQVPPHARTGRGNCPPAGHRYVDASPAGRVTGGATRPLSHECSPAARGTHELSRAPPPAPPAACCLSSSPIPAPPAWSARCARRYVAKSASTRTQGSCTAP